MLHQGDEHGQEKESHCSLVAAGWRESASFNTINLTEAPSLADLRFWSARKVQMCVFHVNMKKINDQQLKFDVRIAQIFAKQEEKIRGINGVVQSQR